jgi:hypothetical protein
VRGAISNGRPYRDQYLGGQFTISRHIVLMDFPASLDKPEGVSAAKRINSRQRVHRHPLRAGSATTKPETAGPAARQVPNMTAADAAGEVSVKSGH